ncbi:hypothetical protein C8P64_2116 [Christiangramia gaetbulicola]|uniref:Uncharacterized protein n=1 Tax=Christiangramia gaetbulicola TaxID=703340 RepID=A0A2T6AIG7_9FLAO|nr:hypothetical protein [Christiangramia gaetbulicola]PTX43587.1 hypothetical protein C8P64_2116 [Christiangramia gaetbulicola]
MTLPRYYELENLISSDPNFIQNIDILIVGSNSEFRSSHIPLKFKENFTGKIYAVNYLIEEEGYQIEETTIPIKKNLFDKKRAYKSLNSDLLNDLKSLEIDNKSILLDSTSFKHPLLFYFIYLFKKYLNPKRFFITYTEPQEYDTISNDEINLKFNLTEKFCDVNSMPGFLRISDHNKNKLLVAIMGFEGNRFGKAFEDINPGTRKTYAFVGFPSFQPGWQYYVYLENRNTLESSKSHQFIYRSSANEPFGIYRLLNDIKKSQSEDEIWLAPLGTKPHSIGACMFAIDNEDVQIYYDFPSHGKKIRTIGVGKSFIYNLSDYINE